MLQTIEVEIDAQGGIHPLQTLPPTAERRALLTLVIPEIPLVKMDWRSFVGTLKNSSCFNEDPVEIQRKMRDEWH
ncbi:MAG: hypothetical protein ABL911_01610 [Gallionella sp.]|jgi:hypothetical protein